MFVFFRGIWYCHCVVATIKPHNDLLLQNEREIRWEFEPRTIYIQLQTSLGNKITENQMTFIFIADS